MATRFFSDRDITIFRKIMLGKTYEEVGAAYAISTTRASQIFWKLSRVLINRYVLRGGYVPPHMSAMIANFVKERHSLSEYRKNARTILTVFDLAVEDTRKKEQQ